MAGQTLGATTDRLVEHDLLSFARLQNQLEGRTDAGGAEIFHLCGWPGNRSRAERVVIYGEFFYCAVYLVFFAARRPGLFSDLSASAADGPGTSRTIAQKHRRRRSRRDSWIIRRRRRPRLARGLGLLVFWRAVCGVVG